MSTASSNRRPLFAAITLFVVALAIRLIGVTWALPNDLHNESLHPDEGFVYFTYAYPEGASVFKPGNYNYPGLYPITLRLAGDVIATYGGYDTPSTIPPLDFTTAHFSDFKAYQAKVAPHLRVTNIVGRVLNCIAGAATAVVVFFILLRFAGMAGAVFGGLLGAIAPALVVHARFQTVDVFATFFMWLSILYAVKLYFDNEGKLDARHAMLAGLFAGLSAGTKYTGVFALLAMIVAVALTRRQNWLRNLALSGLVCVVAFVVTTPGCLLETSRFLFGIQLERNHMREGHDFSFVHSPSGFLYQLGNLFTGVGPLAFILGMFGLLYAVVKKKAWIWIPLAPAIAYYLILGPSQVKFVRYGLPLIPAVCIGFGYAINGALQRPKWKLMGTAVGAVSILGLESLALASQEPSPYWACFDPRFGELVGTLRYTKNMTQPDPRDQAAEYVLNLAKTEPNTTVSLLRVPWYWTVPVVKDTVLLYNPPIKVDVVAFQNGYFATTQNPHVARALDMPDARYAVLSTLETVPFDRIQNDSQVPEIWRARYEELDGVLKNIREHYDVVATFGGEAPAVEDLMYVQPKAYVLKHK